MTEKSSNPKDLVGVKKAPLSCVSAPVLYEIGLGMLEGGRKYGRHNYRVVGVAASTYYDGALRHLTAWWEGEDIDPDSGLPHLSKLLSDIVVLRDAQICEKWVDDRPPRPPKGWLAKMNELAKHIVETVKPDGAVEPYTELNKDEKR